MPTIFLTRKENHTQIFLQALGLSLIPASCFGFRGPDVERTTNSPLRKLAEGALEMLTPSLVMTWLSRECVDVAILGRGRPPRLGGRRLRSSSGYFAAGMRLSGIAVLSLIATLVGPLLVGCHHQPQGEKEPPLTIAVDPELGPVPATLSDDGKRGPRPLAAIRSK